jgi:two-component system, LytTR family, sensor kinase
MKRRLLLHTLFWVAYYVSVSYITASYDDRYYRAFMSEAVSLPLKIVATYFVLYYLLPKYLFKKKYLQFVLVSVVLILITGVSFRILQGAIILPYFYPELPFTPWDPSRFMWDAFEVFSASAIAVSIKLYLLKQQSQLHEQELEKEKLQAELSFLKAQINPHFLFNTLNNIYGLSLKNSEQTPGTILKLSSLLRFMLEDGAAAKIKIRDEVQNLDNYIELERLRYNDRLNIDFKKEIDNENEMIAPLLLLPFVENSFKHGASESQFDSAISISLTLKNHLLSFEVINSKEAEISKKENKGIGLKNIQRQLELIYGKYQSLKIKNSQDIFKTYLTINLGEYEKAQMPDR